MKRIYRGLLLFLLSCLCFLTPAAAADIRVKLDDRPISFDTAPFIENGRVLVPVRGILESLGYALYWQEDTQSVLAMNDTVTISLTINSNTALVNDTPVSIDAPALIRNGRTFVPLRFLAGYSGADVLWNGEDSTVSIYSGNVVPEQRMRQSVVYIQTNKIQGSGVVLSSDGLIATNFHVVENASTMQFIFHNGQVYQGDVTIVGLSPTQDIALLKIEKNGLTPARLSTDYADGDAVTAIGAPHGVRNTATTGVITGFNESIIATTAVIAQGSSGGGLFDAQGNLIGMTSAYNSGQYFSIPISLVQQVPHDFSLPLSGMKHYTYTPKAPENLRFVKKDGYAYVSWSPVYKAEHYYVYTSNSENGSYRKLRNSTLSSNSWYWGFPHSFGISINPRQPYYMKVSAVINGVETPLSQPLKISR